MALCDCELLFLLSSQNIYLVMVLDILRYNFASKTYNFMELEALKAYWLIQNLIFTIRSYILNEFFLASR